jgi:hypothetical protein
VHSESDQIDTDQICVIVVVGDFGTKCYTLIHYPLASPCVSYNTHRLSFHLVLSRFCVRCPEGFVVRSAWKTCCS